MIYIGCSGWYYNHWREVFYPESLDKKEWLSYYTKFFNTVEINASFYRIPFSGVVKGWYKKSPSSFLFTLKANRKITHEGTPGENKEILRRFYGLSEILKEKLGCVLFQFPPSLRRNDEILKRFLEGLAPNKRNVIEFRHKSWFNDAVYKILEQNNTGFCIISAPGLPEDIVVTSSFSYIRWHGKKRWYRYEYSKMELERWKKIIKELSKKGDVFGYFNNDFYGYAVKNALEIKGLLR